MEEQTNKTSKERHLLQAHRETRYEKELHKNVWENKREKRRGFWRLWEYRFKAPFLVKLFSINMFETSELNKVI
ncbi:MAG: hypothetical protein QW461_07330 [Candidatus Jordarchaeales archaeon]